MNLVNVVLIDNHLHHCTIVNRDFVIRLRNENEGVWPRPTQLWELHCAFVIRLNVVNEGGAESDRLGWHSRFANENEGRREELSLNDSVNDSLLPETRLNEQTNEQLFLANWTTRTDSRKRIMKSITNTHRPRLITDATSLSHTHNHTHITWATANFWSDNTHTHTQYRPS